MFESETFGYNGLYFDLGNFDFFSSFVKKSAKDEDRLMNESGQYKLVPQLFEL